MYQYRSSTLEALIMAAVGHGADEEAFRNHLRNAYDALVSLWDCSEIDNSILIECVRAFHMGRHQNVSCWIGYNDFDSSQARFEWIDSGFSNDQITVLDSLHVADSKVNVPEIQAHSLRAAAEQLVALGLIPNVQQAWVAGMTAAYEFAEELLSVSIEAVKLFARCMLLLLEETEDFAA